MTVSSIAWSVSVTSYRHGSDSVDIYRPLPCVSIQGKMCLCRQGTIDIAEVVLIRGYRHLSANVDSTV